MHLADTYDEIRPTIVALIERFLPAGEDRPLYPHILGTAFVIDESGVLATNEHVVAHIAALERPAGLAPDEPLALAVLSWMTEGEYNQVIVGVIGWAQIDKFHTHPTAVIKERPDVALVQLECCGLTPVRLNSTTLLREGIEVATAGYTMGTYGLTAPGHLQQVTPTLQRGIVSAVLPCPSPRPAGFTIDIMTQPGASGSPVFCPSTGSVFGILGGGLEDTYDDERLGSYRVPTSFSCCWPSRVISDLLDHYKRSDVAKSIPHLVPLEEVKANCQSINLGIQNITDALEPTVLGKTPDDGSSPPRRQYGRWRSTARRKE